MHVLRKLLCTAATGGWCPSELGTGGVALSLFLKITRNATQQFAHAPVYQPLLTSPQSTDRHKTPHKKLSPHVIPHPAQSHTFIILSSVLADGDLRIDRQVDELHYLIRRTAKTRNVVLRDRRASRRRHAGHSRVVDW